MVTNIAQLRELVRTEWRLNCAINLTGMVCAVSAAKSVVTLADETGAEVFALDFQGQHLAVGQKIRLSGDRCEVTRRRMELAIRRAPLVANDGQHGAQDRSGQVKLSAGRHPFRLEWFNTGGASELSLEVEGPGLARQRVPDSWLWRRAKLGADTNEFEAGLQARSYEGNWLYLPDFGERPVIKAGPVPNCDLNFRSRLDNVGLEFLGWLAAPVAGDYRFWLRSDDGSQLYLGDAEPQLEVIGVGSLPVVQKYFIGQVVAPTAAYQRVQVEGTVRHLVERSGRLELELQSRTGNRMQIEFADGEGLATELLLNSQARITGVSREVLIPGGQRIIGLLSAVNRQDFQFIEVASEVWSAFPVVKIAALNAGVSNAAANSIVHLAGTLKSATGAGHLLISDDSGSILVERNPAGEAVLGRPVEAIGRLQRLGPNQFLVNAGFRRQLTVEGKPLPLPQLTTAEQVLRLGRNEAQRAYPVTLRGVITCTWPDAYRNAVIQDATRGIFVTLPASGQGGRPGIGEFWELSGVTAEGIFSPVVKVNKMTRLSEGRLPSPVKPGWDQLLNGSLDALYVEIEGIIINTEGANIQLLTQWGKITVEFLGERPEALPRFVNKLIRIRGCLLAAWDEKTHQLKVGELRLGSATISADQTLAADPFAAPLKSVGDLLLFDIQASTFQRVRMTGLVLRQHGDMVFMMSGTNGVRFIPRDDLVLHPGDLVEVAGIPELGRSAPVLREAVVRRTGSAELPPAMKLAPEHILPAAHDATRLTIEGLLVNARNSRGEQLLEMQSSGRLFTARLLERDGLLPVLESRSTLALTGVCADQSTVKTTGQAADHFELLLSSPGDVVVLSRPPWWTLRRLLVALGILIVVLAGAGLWVVQLRRRVETQTEIIRDSVKQTATLEERSRIARELHDTLEQSLAGISFQLGALAGVLRGRSADGVQILERARLMVKHGQEEARRSVRNLRMFALERGNLSDAIAEMAQESANGMAVKIETLVKGEPVKLAYQVENHLLRIGQEALTNALKHGKAGSVKFELNYATDWVALTVSDDGCGFDVAQTAPTEAGHFGLLGMRERVNKIGGTIQIHSVPGTGTAIAVTVPRKQAQPETEYP